MLRKCKLSFLSTFLWSLSLSLCFYVPLSLFLAIYLFTNISIYLTQSFSLPLLLFFRVKLLVMISTHFFCTPFIRQTAYHICISIPREGFSLLGEMVAHRARVKKKEKRKKPTRYILILGSSLCWIKEIFAFAWVPCFIND